jgi:hypothetical protein
MTPWELGAPGKRSGNGATRLPRADVCRRPRAAAAAMDSYLEPMRMKCLLIKVAAILISVLVLGGENLRAAFTEGQFWKEFIPGVKQLDQFYSNIQIEATCRSEYPNSRVNPVRESRIVFFSNGALQRLDFIQLDPKTGQVQEETSYVATPNRSFVVGRLGSRKDYALRNADNGYDETRFRIRTLNLPLQAFIGNYKSLQELYEKKDVRIDSIEESTDDHGSLIKVAFQTLRPVKPATGTTVSGWIEFMPNRFWAVRRSLLRPTKTLPHSAVKESIIDYDADANGFPLVSAINQKTTDLDTGVVYPDNWTVTKILPEAVDPYQFTPEAFGLHIPEPFNYNRLILLIIAGTLLLVIGIVIWRWKSRASMA